MILQKHQTWDEAKIDWQPPARQSEALTDHCSDRTLHTGSPEKAEMPAKQSRQCKQQQPTEQQRQQLTEKRQQGGITGK